MQKIIPCLWFDNNAEEAVAFYSTIFKKTSADTASKYDEESSKASGQPKGSVMTVPFEINGMKFLALNGGPMFKFTEAISFIVNCTDQKEIDYYWDRLSEGGEESQCGWLKDKYGVSWQIVPADLGKLMQEPEQAKRVMKEILTMKKIDMERIEKA